MENYYGYLICSDLDETLTHNGRMIEQNTASIKKYIENGGLFTLSTGRTPAYLFETYGREALGINTYLICLNGTVICDPDSKDIVWERSYPKETLAELEFISKDFRGILNMNYYCFENSFTHYSEIPDGSKINKTVIAFDTPESCHRLRQRLEAEYRGIFSFNKSWDTGLEILPINAGKGACIREMRKILGDKVKTIVAVGDNENDLTMIQEADIGYAVENAIPELKSAADRITVSCLDGAISRIIKDILV